MFLPTVVEVLDDLPASAERQIKTEIEKFQSGWSIQTVFEKPVSDKVDQIKKDRSRLRAFGAPWQCKGFHILFVLAVYRKEDEEEYWNQAEVFEERAAEYFARFDEAAERGSVREKLEALQDNPEYLVVPP